MLSQVLVTAGLLSAHAADAQYNDAAGSQSGSASSGQNYQQYMKEFAGSKNGDYQQYMKKYGGGQSGDYQQYMGKYAGGHSGDFQQYMNKYAKGQGGSGGSQTGDYQQYMSKYAGGQGGDYKQYMQKYTGGQGGNYQQYMEKYTGGSKGGSQSSDDYSKYASPTELIQKPPAKSSDSLDTLNLDATATNSEGNYQQYMNSYGGGSDSGSKSQSGQSQSQSGNYQQYMKKYAGGQGGDYQQYMKKYAGGQGGDYQQYMKKYAGGQGGDYQQYMKKYAGGQGGDYQQYMKKYSGGQGNQQGATPATELIEKAPTKTSSDSSDTLNLASTDSKDASSSDSQGNYQQYMDKYAGSYEKYMKQYAGDYQKYQNYQKFKDCGKSGDSKVRSAKDAQNKQELQEWKLGALKKVECFVPDDYSSYASHDIDKTYNMRLDELSNDAATTQSPFVANDAVELNEKPQMVEKTQTAKKTFLAKSDAAAAGAKTDKAAEHKSEITQSQAETNVALFADQVKADPTTAVPASVLGAALAFLVFFAVRYRRNNVQLPVAQLG